MILLIRNKVNDVCKALKFLKNIKKLRIIFPFLNSIYLIIFKYGLKKSSIVKLYLKAAKIHEAFEFLPTIQTRRVINLKTMQQQVNNCSSHINRNNLITVKIGQARILHHRHLEQVENSIKKFRLLVKITMRNQCCYRVTKSTNKS